jgi:hypothetical protein
LRIEDPITPSQNQPRHSLRIASNNTNATVGKKSKKTELTPHQTLMHMTRLRERMANAGQTKIANSSASKPNGLAKSSSLIKSSTSSALPSRASGSKKTPNGVKPVEVQSLQKRKKADYIQPKMKRIKVYAFVVVHLFVYLFVTY